MEKFNLYTLYISWVELLAAAMGLLKTAPLKRWRRSELPGAAPESCARSCPCPCYPDTHRPTLPHPEMPSPHLQSTPTKLGRHNSWLCWHWKPVMFNFTFPLTLCLRSADIGFICLPLINLKGLALTILVSFR